MLIQAFDGGNSIEDLAGPGVAVREFSLAKGHGRADYLLYVDGKVIGVIEAMPEGHALKGVETQSAMYTDGLPDDIPSGGFLSPSPTSPQVLSHSFTNGLEKLPKIWKPQWSFFRALPLS